MNYSINYSHKMKKGILNTDCPYGNPDCPKCHKKEEKECNHDFNEWAVCKKCNKHWGVETSKDIIKNIIKGECTCGHLLKYHQAKRFGDA